jgi:hypothetical protein
MEKGILAAQEDGGNEHLRANGLQRTGLTALNIQRSRLLLLLLLLLLI